MDCWCLHFAGVDQGSYCVAVSRTNRINALDRIRIIRPEPYCLVALLLFTPSLSVIAYPLLPTLVPLFLTLVYTWPLRCIEGFDSKSLFPIPVYLRKLLHPKLGSVTGCSSGRRTETLMHGTASSAVTRRPKTGCCSETLEYQCIKICTSYRVHVRAGYPAAWLCLFCKNKDGSLLRKIRFENQKDLQRDFYMVASECRTPVAFRGSTDHTFGVTK